MINFRNIIVVASLMGTAAVWADELEKKIDIDREVVPELRAASRLNLSPTMVSPQITPVTLMEANYMKAAPIPTFIGTFDPAPTEQAIAVSDYRGYVSGGLFPAFNADISAGYRLIGRTATRMNVWMQYNLTNYEHPLAGEKHNSSFNDNTLTAGTAFTHAFDGVGRLTLGADYMFSRFNEPWIATDSVQRYSRFRLMGDWRGKAGRFDYRGGATYVHAGFSKGMMVGGYAFPALAENAVELRGSVATDVLQGQRAELGARLMVDNYNHGVGTVGLLDLNPRYRFLVDAFEAQLGMKIDFSFNSGRCIAVAPDIRISATPSSMFTASLSLGGGLVGNQMWGLFDECHYQAPFAAYGNSRLPLTVDAAMGFGPYRGAYLEIFGGYAVADNWLMPSVSYGTHVYQKVDLKGWHFGVKATYSYRRFATLAVSFEGAPSDYDQGYYLWRDRAKAVFDANLTLLPAERIEAALGFNLRTSRSSYAFFSPVGGDYALLEGEAVTADGSVRKIDLRSASNLYVSGRYAFSDVLSAFLRLDNILNRHHYLIAGVPSQGFTGMAGVAYKF